jgi:hypothetical protein
MEWLATRDEEFDLQAAFEEVHQAGGRRKHPLEIVQNEQVLRFLKYTMSRSSTEPLSVSWSPTPWASVEGTRSGSRSSVRSMKEAF